MRKDLSYMRKRTLFAPLWVMLALALVLGAAGVWFYVAQSTTTVILVRHAEKATEPADDPGLTPAGSLRAHALAHSVEALELDAVFASGFQRTQATARPSAGAADLPVTVVEADAVEALAERILEEHRGGVVLVVGHSNTVPEIVRALGGREVDEIPDHVYDRLFVLQVQRFGRTRVIPLKYGEPG